jgi:hypothetical protein
MSLWGKVFAAGVCVAILGCGPSEPDSPLILGSEGKDAEPGLRTLTEGQTHHLQDAIAGSGAECELVERTYLRRAVPDQFETWDVRCDRGNYSVHIFADGTPADVQRCFGWSWDGCAESYSGPRFRQGPDRRAPPGELNPDLGRLLEQMDKEGGKKE